MAEVEFERRLERLFAEAPAFDDADAFAERVERRLDRGWRARRLLIGAAGVVGGVIGASQLIMSNFVQRMEAASEGSARIISAGLTEVAPRADWLGPMSYAGEGVWLAVGLAIAATGFALTRVIGEI